MHFPAKKPQAKKETRTVTAQAGPMAARAVFNASQLVDLHDGSFAVHVENPLRYSYDQGPDAGTTLSGQGESPQGTVFLSINPLGGWECRPNDPAVIGAWERFYKQDGLIIVKPSDFDANQPHVAYAFICSEK
jgi:hypothetical protein